MAEAFVAIMKTWAFWITFEVLFVGGDPHSAQLSPFDFVHLTAVELSVRVRELVFYKGKAHSDVGAEFLFTSSG